ncbi:MAG TPA: trimeric intracellular cation channel family protein [Firmicutes bacterium]|nr:trimeric intracellular cation channel family protein [Bacillales bacterium]HJA41344.1 trimeric intracellular cation channel family protein [Bacillota bacterium]
MELLNIFMFLGIFACGVSGAMVGIQKRMDLFGVICLAAFTALGGGIARDLLLGINPPTSFIHPIYFGVSLLATFVAWLFYHRVKNYNHMIIRTDAIGLGVFTGLGANTAIEQGYNDPFIIVMMGVITGIGGGVLRDVFSREIPFVFRKEIYAVASILGAVALLLTYKINILLSLYLCLVITFTVRILAVRNNWNFPVLSSKLKDSESYWKKKIK